MKALKETVMIKKEPENLSFEEIILSFNAGKPYMIWIRFDDSYGPQPCTKCKMPCRTLIMTSPTGGVCDPCWERGI